MYTTIPPAEALKRLIEGNRRYAADEAPAGTLEHAVKRRHTIAEQRPFAIVLGCSDSRVPIEIVFNQSLGDLFVVRVAGNILSDHVIGSVEYAVETFGCSLAMVLGHANCGAVTAAVESVVKHRPVPARIATIVDAIRPSVELVSGQADLLDAAIAQNVRATTSSLQQMQPIIAAARANGRLAVIGAEYQLSTGLISILCGDLVEATP
jgi:carbonic anhydrase